MANESRPRHGGPGAATSGTTGQAVRLAASIGDAPDDRGRDALVVGLISLVAYRAVRDAVDSCVASTTVDDEAAATLRLIAGDPIHERDRAEIVAAIVAAAEEDDGHVNPNAVRARIVGNPYPRVIGATYYALRRAGVLVPHGRTVSTDTAGRNSGKPCRTYRLAAQRILS